ncbi:MAG: hypothetical protein ISS23_01270 [Nanoarchaeota archaeon]|nr:hypothetical protein [Nanoarchaeota archaeon]
MIGQLIGGLITIIIGIIAVIKLIADAELIVSALSLTFGVTALIWVFKARRSLSKGSSLKELTTHFLLIVIFVLCFSFWNVLIKMLALKDIYGDTIIFLQYLFISFAYIAFVGAAYKIRKIGQEFGFSPQAKNIKKIIKEKKKKK